MKRTPSGSLRPEHIGQTVLLQGWVNRRRDHGGVTFIDLRDRSGRAQVVFHDDRQPQVAAALAPARNEWVVEVEGEVVARAATAVNPNLATGMVEVVASRARILARSLPVPFPLDDAESAAEDTRLRFRYLDLRRPFLQEAVRLRHRAILDTLNYCDENGFLIVETPTLTRSTPEGARDFLVPSRVHRGKFYALPQSPQLFKQILQVSGFERYVQIARCFRDEDPRHDRQPEFTQIDLELSFIDEEDVYSLVEGLLVRVFGGAGIDVPTPFRRIPYREAMLRFGSDRPDLRVDLEISDITDLWRESSFRGFQSAVALGGVIRAVPGPGAAGVSRKQIDAWGEIAKRHGAAGVLVLRHDGGSPSFQVKDVLSTDQVKAASERLGLAEGDLALVVAGPEKSTAAALGALRSELAHACGRIREDAWEFLWVTEFPLVEWNNEEQRWDALHHPFTSPREQDLQRMESDPGGVLARAYDVVLNGYELGGGSIRIHDSAVQERMFSLLGIAPEQARSRFGFLLDALSYGAPPHGGLALGLDRIIMLMGGYTSLRDVIAFPKTTSGLCLMTEAPSSVDLAQLQEVGIRTVSAEAAAVRHGQAVDEGGVAGTPAPANES